MNTSNSNENSITYALTELGWQAYFQQQLSLDELEQSFCGRVIAHHRNAYIVQLENTQISLVISSSLPAMTVGDWLILDSNKQFNRLLQRKSLVSRRAAGTKVVEQYIAANIDTMFIVCSLNQDFNLNRIERYLAIANEAQVEPVVVLTKKDLCENWQAHVSQVQALDPFLAVEAVCALEKSSVESLSSWCTSGKTVSFLGSSGVGKSSLVNTLLGVSEQVTSHIREDDSKGRHTTTSRSLHFMVNGSVLLDTPGMREIQLVECHDGLNKTFADIELLEISCRFSDCQHQNEPGCAILQALDNGSLEQRRLDNFLKLREEQARNAASLKEKRDKSKALSKMYRSVSIDARQMKKGY